MKYRKKQRYQQKGNTICECSQFALYFSNIFCLVVAFIGEARREAVDTGGPMRELFGCKFIRLNFFS